MARTKLMSAVRRALAESGAAFGPRALTRRSFLAMSAALAACTPLGPAESVGIVGAGAAGLTVAYRLARAGRNATLYEASGRIGGRMFTRHNFNADGQFCELGGELVDTGHEALRALAQEVGVGIERLAPEGDKSEDLYHIGGRLRAEHEMLDAHGRGAFRALALRIAQDKDALLDSDENWTDRARALDQVSLHAYLAQLANRAPGWVMRVLELAYLGEYGMPTNEQSSLNLVDFIGVKPDEGFRIFGDSDEAFRIAGGSSTLTDALAARLTHVETKVQHALVGVARDTNGVRLTFEAPGGRIERTHAHVVLALPFTKLRGVQGIDALGLPEVKLRAIRELGYGDNAKLIVSTSSRPWNEGGRFPVHSDGVFFSDRFQETWDTSRAQRGTRGVLTNFLSGQDDLERAIANLQAGMEALSPAIAASIDPDSSAWMAWAQYPFALGSYAGAKVGQYTTLLEETATPALDGRLHFAGEHTSTDFIGFMNGAVESGERVAREILAPARQVAR